MKDDAKAQAFLEEKFLASLRHHLAGLKAKIEEDFSKESFKRELAGLRGDTLYSAFCLDSPEYVLIRFMGRVSISIGRRLGEIYDKVPRLVAAARFGLPANVVAPVINGLELDIGLRFDKLGAEDVRHVQGMMAKHIRDVSKKAGIGIEIRYNFNPNDSARLRKDVDMAQYLEKENLAPVYLIFSSISPRDEAIARLKRAGWDFLVGDAASAFANELLGLDLLRILDDPKVKAEVRKDITSIMAAITDSYAFRQVLGE